MQMNWQIDIESDDEKLKRDSEKDVILLIKSFEAYQEDLSNTLSESQAIWDGRVRTINAAKHKIELTWVWHGQFTVGNAELGPKYELVSQCKLRGVQKGASSGIWAVPTLPIRNKEG